MRYRLLSDPGHQQREKQNERRGQRPDIVFYATNFTNHVKTIFHVPGHALHEKGLQRQLRRRRYIGQQPGMKSGRRPADKPWVNRGFCSSIGLHRVGFVRASRDTPRRVIFDRLGGARDGCLLGEPTRRRPVLPVPAPLRRPAVRRPPDPPVICPGFGLDKFQN